MIYKIIVIIILILAEIEDYKKKEVSNVYFISLLFLGLFKGYIISFNTISTIIFLIIIKQIFDKNIGYGDIKIMIGLTLLYGSMIVLDTFILASIISIIYMDVTKKKKISFLPVYNTIFIIFLLFFTKNT